MRAAIREKAIPMLLCVTCNWSWYGSSASPGEVGSRAVVDRCGSETTDGTESSYSDLLPWPE